MKILSASCLGGYVYRDILKQEYTVPFIWTGMDDVLDFAHFINDFDKINFDNMTIEKIGEGLKNNFFTVIDDKYKFKNSHIIFDANANVPIVKKVDVFYNKPWEYIYSKYHKRLERMKQDSGPICVIVYNWRDRNKEHFELLSKICTKKQYKTLIFTDFKISESNYVKRINFKRTIDEWNVELLQKHKKDIENFLNNLI